MLMKRNQLKQKFCAILLFLFGIILGINAAVYTVSDRNQLSTYMYSSTDYQGDTIRMSSDFSITNTINVNGTKVFDLNGHKLTSASDYVFYANSGSKLTVLGSENDTIQSATYVFVLAHAELIIDGGVIIGGQYTPAIGTTTSSSSSKSTITINGGIIDCKVRMAVKLKQYDELIMTGGIIRGLDAESGSSVMLKAGTIEAGNNFYYSHPGSTLAADVAPGSVVSFNGVVTDTESLTADTYNQTFVVSAPNENQHLVIAKPDAAGRGTVTGTNIYNDGETATLTATPATGFKFVRWSDDNTENPRYLTVTEDVTLTAIFDYDITLSWDNYKAKWNAVPGATDYVVYLYKDNNRISVSGSYAPGYVGNVTEYDMQSLIEGQGNGTYKFTVNPYVNGGLGGVSAPSPEKEFIVYVMCNVTFNSNGGTAIAQQEIIEGQTATKPEDPTKEGYKFGGWYTDETLTNAFSFSSAITQDTTLYAKWIEKILIVTTMTWDGYKAQWNAVDDATSYWLALYKNGVPLETGSGTTIPGGVGNVTEYDLQSLIEANGNGVYTFTVVPFFNSNLGTVSEQSPEQAFKITCTVTFLDMDGGVIKEEEVRMNQDATAPVDPTREGYTFTGWDKEFNNVTEDLVVNATYSKNSYHVTFVDFDDSVLKEEDVLYQEAATAPADPTREGYTFTGWDKEFSSITAAITVMATYTINTYTVTVVAEHGSVSAADADNNPVDLSQPVEYGKVIFLTATPDEGYEFSSWENYDAETGLTVTATVTVTAIFNQVITEGFESIRTSEHAAKILRNGQIFILRGNMTYTLTGAEVK